MWPNLVLRLRAAPLHNCSANFVLGKGFRIFYNVFIIPVQSMTRPNAILFLFGLHFHFISIKEWFCYAGFTGRKCEKDPCSSAPCLNGGSCMSMALNGSTTFHCACPEGWMGAHCDISAVEGACASNPCVNGICIEHTDEQIQEEKFRCFCQPGK